MSRLSASSVPSWTQSRTTSTATARLRRLSERRRAVDEELGAAHAGPAELEGRGARVVVGEEGVVLLHVNLQTVTTTTAMRMAPLAAEVLLARLQHEAAAEPKDSVVARLEGGLLQTQTTRALFQTACAAQLRPNEQATVQPTRDDSSSLARSRERSSADFS